LFLVRIAVFLVDHSMNIEIKTNPIPGQGNRPLGRAALGALIVCWGAALAGGFALLADRDARPAPQGRTIERWPEGSHWKFDQERPTLLMFVHPRCPCSRASLTELERILAEHPNADARLVMVKPQGAPDDWDQSATAKAAKELPGVTILRDERGEEAKVFGALTSGQTFLYDASGQLLFRGGITAGRGHFGENFSSDKLQQLLTGGKSMGQTTPVYGCPLENSDSTK
jgi:hypothetical protein